MGKEDVFMDENKIAAELVDIARNLVGHERKAELVGHHHKEGGKWYVDSNFINIVQRVYPGATLKHMGFGEFYLETPDGKMEFDRMRGRNFEGQVGRPHQVYDDVNDKVVKKAIKLMERAGRSEEV
jgi:hypothetical protein